MKSMRILKCLLLLMLIGIIGCESQEAARRRQIANNLKQIGLALQAYEAKTAQPVGHTKSETDAR